MSSPSRSTWAKIQPTFNKPKKKGQAMKTEHYTVDAKEEFAEKFCWPASSQWRLSGLSNVHVHRPAADRPKGGREGARKLGVTAFAHGCTGKGNDQYRIEFGIRTLMPDAVIHAPVRERNLTRSWEIEYAAEKGRTGATVAQQNLVDR